MSLIETEAAFDGLATRLASRATTLAIAHATARILARRGDESRWRRAGLVWPLFAKG